MEVGLKCVGGGEGGLKASLVTSGPPINLDAEKCIRVTRKEDEGAEGGVCGS